MHNILSFDIEEWFQTANLAEHFPRNSWADCESRIMIGADKILRLLLKKEVKATFFILGWIADRNPQLVRNIDQAGHEIATHGYEHRLIYHQSQVEFRDDLRKSIDILQNITKKKVLGFRAPSYSITKQSLWAFDILSEEGIRYDSSVYPLRRYARGGMPGSNLKPFRISGDLEEFPLGVATVFGYRLPIASGAYFRLCPYSFTKWAIKKMNKKGIPIVVNLHAWEFDPQQAVVKVKHFYKIRHYLNLNKTEDRLKMLLDDFSFLPARDFLLKKELEP